MTRRRLFAVLIGLTVLALALRLWGIGFGLPLDLRPDEHYFRVVPEQMVRAGEANPHFFAYPGLPFHLTVAVMKGVQLGAALIGHDAADRPLHELIGDRALSTPVLRLLAAMLGAATIPWLYLLGARLRNRTVGLCAATLAAFCYVHVRHSHFAVTDVPAVLFVSVALWSVIRAIQQTSRGAFVTAGVLCGLAAAIRYTPAVLAVSLLIAAIGVLHGEGKSWRSMLSDARLPLAAVAMVLTFLIANPYTVLAWDEFRAGFPGQTDVKLGWFGLETIQRHLAVSLRYGFGVPLLLLAVAGTIRTIRQPATGRLAVLAYGAIQIGLLVFSDRSFVRYALPLVPVLILFAAEGLDWARERLPGRLRSAGLFALMLVAVAPSMYRAVASDLLFARPSSLQELDDWVARELPADSGLSFSSPLMAARVLSHLPNAGYDPLRILYGPEPSYVVAMDHPLRYVEPPEGVEQLLGVAADHEVVFRSEALSATRRDDVVFDVEDAFLYPFAGFHGAHAGGPDVTVYRVTPRAGPPEEVALPAAPADVRARALGKQLAVEWAPADGAQPLGYYVRFGTVEDVRAGREVAAVAFPAGRRTYGSPELRPGQYLVLVSAVGAAGESERVAAGPVEIVGAQAAQRIAR